jgi:hypothetical protein
MNRTCSRRETSAGSSFGFGPLHGLDEFRVLLLGNVVFLLARLPQHVAGVLLDFRAPFAEQRIREIFNCIDAVTHVGGLGSLFRSVALRRSTMMLRLCTPSRKKHPKYADFPVEHQQEILRRLNEEWTKDQCREYSPPPKEKK